MLNPVKVLFILFAIKYVKSDSCVTYNFDEYFDELFSVSDMCTAMEAEGEWTLGNYSMTSVEQPHPASTSFISPGTILSCISSFTFAISNGGKFEVNIYMDAEDTSDRIQIFLNKIEKEDIDTVVTAISLNPWLTTYQRGWNRLTATIIATETYEGYLTFITSTTEGSTLLVDSFRYIPASYKNDNCVIYPQKTEPEEAGSEEIDENSYTDSGDSDSHACVTYNFEESFENLFSDGRWCTNGEAEGEWTLGNYSMTSVKSPHPASTSFISPGTIMSCTSSFTFSMSSGGIFEINVFMDATETSNQLLIFVNELVEGDDDTQVAVIQLNPNLPLYQEGWNTLTETLGGNGTYVGYVTLMAVAAESSKLLVDSFRYIPVPSLNEIDDCELYSLETEPDGADSAQNKSEENISNETAPNITEENNSNQTDEDNTDDSEETDPHTCVTYDFEESFEENFSYSRMCTTMPADGEWTLGYYSLTSVKLPNPASTSFITPGTIMSCTSSFIFIMSNGGTFEVNVYMDANDTSNPLLIFVNELVEGGDDTQVATIQLNPNLPTFQKGWNSLTATLGGTGTFEGYVTLIGAVSDESIVLVDSFRYIPPEYEIENCVIYSQETEPEDSNESDPNQTEENNSNHTDEEETSEIEDLSEPNENETNEIDESHQTSEETTDEIFPNLTEENNSNQTEENNTAETEDISEPDESETIEIEESIQTNEDFSVGSNENDSSELPEEKPVRKASFWNPLTIAMVVVITLIALALVSLCFYECGKRRAQDRHPLVYNNNDIEVSPEMRVPRVNRVYPEGRATVY